MTYKQYRKACLANNVEPNRKDFKAGDIPSCVLAAIEPLAMAATAGR
jgi:hypothetical protein